MDNTKKGLIIGILAGFTVGCVIVANDNEYNQFDITDYIFLPSVLGGVGALGGYLVGKLLTK